MKKLVLFLLVSAVLFGCQNVVKNIPSGFVAKELTPTGFNSNIIEAGQVDLGKIAGNGQYTSLVLLEATTITIKEQFGQSNDSSDGEDHRVMTQTTPLTVDIYVQMELPKDAKLRNTAFASITPASYKGDDRVSVIYLQDIYKRFAQMTIRGKVRGIFSKYKGWEEVMNNFDKVNAEISQMVMDVFKSSNTPLELINVQLSNVKEDQRIWDSKNELEAAKNKVQAINSIGEALKNNPNYILIRKWEVLEKLVTSPNAAHINLIVSDDKVQQPLITIPASK